METKFFCRVTCHLNELKKEMNFLPELHSQVATIDEIISNINSPVLIMVMGEFSTGKSTFINALVKKNIATVGARPTTAVITKLSYGTQDKIEVVFLDGTKKIVNTDEFSKLTAEVSKHEYDDLHATIAYVSRTLPIDILNHMTIVDSPGLNSIKPIHAETTRKFMDKADTVIWLFSANTPAKQTEIDALKKLNPRLSPVVVLNKIDSVDEEEGESVESIIADIDRKLRNNKIQAQKFISLSAKLAFEGVSKNNPKLLAASNIDEFYDVINNVIIPNRDKYKLNSLFDETAYLVIRLSDKITSLRAKNAFMREENFSEYEKNAHNLEELENCLKSFFKVCLEHVHENADPSEEFLLGVFYFRQIVPSGNKEKNCYYALNHFRKAAELGHHYAMALIGEMYNFGQDYSEALDWFQKAAECGNAEALSCIGTLYYDGAGVEQNYKKAAEFYTKAANLGDSMATNNLAYMYLEGLGISKNFDKARTLFEKAAAAGIPEAMKSLANIYGYGLGVTKNEQEAAKWMLKAAEAGNPNAMFIVSSLYDQGTGLAKDTQKATYWLKEAAAYGNADAIATMGAYYFSGEHGYKKNYQEALKWFKKAADLGYDAAFYWLGTMYYTSQGTSRNYSEAFSWFQKAADAGNEKAYNWLGHMYYDGEGTTCNYFEAFKWFKKAVDAGDEEAFFWLGHMYYDGEGTTRDYFEAFRWFKKAADNGDKRAYYWVGTMYHSGKGVTRNYSQALSWLMKAADNGDGYAMGFIGVMYRYGNGVSQDYDTALTWYQKAINAGNDSARTEKADLENEIERERERQRALTASSSSNTSEDNSNTAMVVGAGIGLFVAGPLGAIAGGWLGKKIFGK